MAFIGDVGGDAHYFLIDRYVGGDANLKEWVYITTDTIDEVTVAGYFADWRGPLPGGGDILRIYTVSDLDDLETLVSVDSVAVIEWDSSYYSLASATPIVSIDDTEYTLTQADNGRILHFTSGSSITLTVPAGIPLPFVAGIAQGGAGQVTVTEGAGTTVHEPDDLLTTEKQYAQVILTGMALDVYWLSGRTA
jgi:hypothetical protein